MTELTAIPAGWTRATIEEVFAQLEDGRTLHQGWSPQCDGEPAGDGEWGVLKTTAIQAGSFHWEHNKRLPPELEPRPAIVVNAGDILLTCAGPRSRCGVPCLVRATRPKLMMSGKMYRFRVPSDHVSAGFVEAFLLSSDAQAAINRMKTGGSDSGLNLTHERFRQLPILLAPTGEQRRIVEAIDSYLTRLDAAVASLERALAKLKAYRASVLKAAVEGRLVPTEASLARAEKRDYESGKALLARILEERRRRWEETELARLNAAGKAPKDDKWKAWYQEPIAPEASSVVDLPEGWCWATVCQIADHRLGKMLDQAKNRGMPRRYLRNANVRWFTFDLADVSEMRVEDGELDEVSIRAGDVVVCEGGEPGRAAVWQKVDEPFVIQKALHRVRPAEGVSPWFLTYVFAAEAAAGRLAKGFTGSTIKHFTGEALRKYRFPFPPREEQQRIAEAVEEALSVIAAVEKTVETAQRRACRLRQATLKWAFEGKLVDQDPADEPAERLLARIQTDRAVGTTTKNTRGRQGRGVA
jgi:type I restriction enzyme S subunit